MSPQELEAQIAAIDAERAALHADRRARLVSALRSARTLARKLGELSPGAPDPPKSPEAEAADAPEPRPRGRKGV